MCLVLWKDRLKTNNKKSMDRKSNLEEKTIEEKGQNSLTKFFPKKTTNTNEVVLAERVEELGKSLKL